MGDKLFMVRITSPGSLPWHFYVNFCLFSDPDDEEYQKNLRRPADVKEDMKQMEDRSRVSLVLNSEAFRRELEDIIDEQIRAGNHPASLLALQQISNLLMPNAKFSQQGTFSKGSKYKPQWSGLFRYYYYIMTMSL